MSRIIYNQVRRMLCLFKPVNIQYNKGNNKITELRTIL